MVQILTPSTGAVREGGKLRLNSSGYQVGERVLVWGAGGWVVSEIAALGDTTVDLPLQPQVPYRQIAGVLQPHVDADDLLARLNAIVAESNAAIRAATDDKWERVMAFLEAGELTRVPPFVPGM